MILGRLLIPMKRSAIVASLVVVYCGQTRMRAAAAGAALRGRLCAASERAGFAVVLRCVRVCARIRACLCLCVCLCLCLHVSVCLSVCLCLYFTAHTDAGRCCYRVPYHGGGSAHCARDGEERLSQW